MSDRRYSTAAWQRLRKAVLARDGCVCRLRGPRCRGYASSVHHLVPSSQAPELFWEPSNLAAACEPCNYGGGARIAAEDTRRTIEDLRALVVEQLTEIAELAARLAHYEDGDGAPEKRPAPAIY
jgi:5-methylcytosine-specific restriction endonuclease McrA